MCSARLAVGLALLAFPLVAAGLAPGRTALPAVAIRSCPPAPPRPRETPIARPRWLTGTVITEYYPAPERWFRGRPVAAPGIPGLHPVDWLYGSFGLAMQGDGIGRDGRFYRFSGPYSTPWVNASGRMTSPCADGSWTEGRPIWLDVGWRNKHGGVTYPLAGGGWSAGAPARFVPHRYRPQFGLGPSRTLTYWHSVAVDPRLIPIGSRVFAPSYCATPSHGWFVAADTGGAIIARHIDVYRPPPNVPFTGNMSRGQRIFVVPPHAAPSKRPHCNGS